MIEILLLFAGSYEQEQVLLLLPIRLSRRFPGSGRRKSNGRKIIAK